MQQFNGTDHVDFTILFSRLPRCLPLALPRCIPPSVGLWLRHAITHSRAFSVWSYRYHWHYRNYAWRSHYRYSYRWPARTHYWRPAVYGAPMSSGSPGPGPAMAAAPGPSRPACLAKTYTPEGAVVFTDRCTQESAVTPPPGADAQGPQPPQQ